MKKVFFLLASAALLIVGCNKEQMSNGTDGGMITATFTANLESGVATRAVADGDGMGEDATRCIMELYYGDELYYRAVEAVNDMVANFTNVPLVSNRKYDVLFWADAGEEYYDASSLKAVKMKTTEYAASDDKRDAFFYSGKKTVGQKGEAYQIELRRPFAQVNIITLDAATVKNAALYPDKVEMVYTAPTRFDVLTGELSEEKKITCSGPVYAAFDAAKTALTLQMDYIFATEEKATLDIAFNAKHEGEADVHHEFTNIPYQRNYRTNIQGTLLTTIGSWTATIVPEWYGNGTGADDDHLYNYIEAGSIAAANEALAEGNNAVSIDTPSDPDTDIVLPKEQDGHNVSIKINGTTGATIDIVLGTDAQGPANLFIESDSDNINVNCPETHVEINKGTYTSVTATTSATTLVVGKEVKVNTLTINGGNAKIYGLVGTINKQLSTVVDFYVSTATGLRNVAEKISTAPQNKDFYGKVYLTADIDLNNEEWTPIAAFQKPLYIDGQGYTIKNLKVTASAIDYIGFIGTACGLTVKNLNFDTVTLSYPSTVGENARGGVIAGQVYGATIENCSVKNVNITACQKVGGLLGYIEGNTNVPHNIKNCSVEKISIKSNDPAKILQHGVGGFIGHISLSNNPLISISGCSVKDITIADFGMKEAEYVPGNNGDIQRVPHAFIGNVCNNHTGEEVADITSHSVVLSNNTISGTNTVLPTCIYSSEYFGWAGNAEERSTWKGGIYIDGQAWVPNYPVKNVTKGTGYPALADAVTVASEGDEIKILKAGTYTVPNISKNVTIIGATEDDVVFNCVGSGSIASISSGATFQNVTMNFGQASYHGFQHAGHIVMKDCTLNGLFFSYGDMTFKGCTFNQENEEYNMWCYGDDITYDGCTFNSKGKFLNIYNESGATCFNIIAKNCVFNTSEKANKAALNIKETCGANFLKYNVTIDDCSCNELQNSLENIDNGTLYRVSPIWQVDDRNSAGETAINVAIDGVKVYPFCSKDSEGNYHIVNAAGLLQFHDLYAAGKVASTAKVYVENDIDFIGKTWDACDWHADGNKRGFALFDGQNHTIKNFTVNGQGMFSRWACTANIGATPYFKDIVFDSAKNVTSKLNVSLFCGQCYQDAKIENVTIKNSQIEGTYKVAPFVGSVYNENPGSTATLTMKDCKVENTTVRGTSYDFDICGIVAWVNETGDNDKITFEGNNVVKDVTLYTPGVTYNMCAKIYHNGDTAYNEATNVTVTNVNVVNGQ